MAGGLGLQAEELGIIWCAAWGPGGGGRPRDQRRRQTGGVGVGKRPPASFPGTGGAVSRVTLGGRERQSQAQVNGKGIQVPRAVVGTEGLPSPAWVP